MAATTIGYRPDKKAIANDKKTFKERIKKAPQDAKKSKQPKESDIPDDTESDIPNNTVGEDKNVD